MSYRIHFQVDLILTDILGRILGFFCHHDYAHSQESERKSIPGAFKGVDLAVFSVFHALGLNVGVHPIIENRSKSMGGLSVKELWRGPTVPRKGDYVENCLEILEQQAAQDPYDFDPDDEEDFDEDSMRKGEEYH